MKRKTIFLTLLFFVMLSIFTAFSSLSATPVLAAETKNETVSPSGTAVIYSVWFRLNGYNGPMYVDIDRDCSSGTTFTVFRRTSDTSVLESNDLARSVWRVWPAMYPNINYRTVIKCYSSSTHGIYRTYDVSYSGSTIHASLVSSGGF